MYSNSEEKKEPSGSHSFYFKKWIIYKMLKIKECQDGAPGAALSGQMAPTDGWHLLMISNRFYCYYYSVTPNAMVTGELDKIMSVSCPNCNGRIEACRRKDDHISTHPRRTIRLLALLAL